MKKGFIASIITAAVIMLLSIFVLPKANAQGYGAVSFDLFYDELSPYGFWENDPSYGDIWFPNVPGGFRPYNTNGYWVMTEYGNTWVSNYDWGWAPFHYGRWVYTSYRGWGWIPGYEWGPAWVEWRSGNGYYGWAPMMPRVGIHVSVGIPVNLWIFAPTRHIFAHDVYRYCYVGRRNIYSRTTIIHNTYIVNNHHYYGGPSRRDMERTIGRRVNVHNVRQSERPGASRTDRRSVSIYRPDLDRSRSASRRTEGNTRDVRSNDRISSNRSNPVESRRNDNRQSVDVNNTNRNNRAIQNERSSNRTSGRELYIDREGRATMRESNNTVRSRPTTAEQNATRTTERQVNRQTESRINRQVEQRQQPQVQRNEQRDNRSQSRSHVERTTPPQPSAPQRQEKNTQPQRTQQPTRQRTSTSQVHQASSSRSSSNSIGRQSTPRVERSSSATRSSSTATSSRSSERSSERSSSGRR